MPRSPRSTWRCRSSRAKRRRASGSPPRLAPARIAILPIFRSDDERATVLEYCRTLEKELAAQQFAGEPIRVLTDARDMRGGEKAWLYVKKGVPIRLEIGPRDVAAGG